jgi:hypothetical protein
MRGATSISKDLRWSCTSRRGGQHSPDLAREARARRLLRIKKLTPLLANQRLVAFSSLTNETWLQGGFLSKLRRRKQIAAQAGVHEPTAKGRRESLRGLLDTWYNSVRERQARSCAMIMSSGRWGRPQ